MDVDVLTVNGCLHHLWIEQYFHVYQGRQRDSWMDFWLKEGSSSCHSHHVPFALDNRHLLSILLSKLGPWLGHLPLLYSCIIHIYNIQYASISNFRMPSFDHQSDGSKDVPFACIIDYYEGRTFPSFVHSSAVLQSFCIFFWKNLEKEPKRNGLEPVS